MQDNISVCPQCADPWKLFLTIVHSEVFLFLTMILAQSPFFFFCTGEPLLPHSPLILLEGKFLWIAVFIFLPTGNTEFVPLKALDLCNLIYFSCWSVKLQGHLRRFGFSQLPLSWIPRSPPHPSCWPWWGSMLNAESSLTELPRFNLFPEYSPILGLTTEVENVKQRRVQRP